MSQTSTRLQPGDTAPDFSLTGDDGATVALSDFRGKRVIVYSYPAAMTPGCTTQACDFRDNLSSLQAAGVHGRRHLAGRAGQAGRVPRPRTA